MLTHDESVEFHTLRWAFDLVNISLPDLYSQPCLDDAISPIKKRIDVLKSKMEKCDMEKIIPLITITKYEYNYFVKRLRWLQCLEDAGVDNWSGYDYARDLAAGREETENAKNS